ncbi:phage virion morphogenesis protein [Marinobacterium litorale]|uniref:phage virion morphogenesis protein n=1 Tax=Marinobacterium litorale TaxID=404770 RepID=UPI000413C76A|nr:phage virion morphogenesis protein [Marinobacterium litorale]
MAGARINFELNDTQVRNVLKAGIQALDNPKPLLVNMREHLHRVHRQRFKDQKAPDGTPWAPLSPRYQKRKKQNGNKILTLRGYLANTLRGVVDDEGLAFGTDRIYGAVHQYGAEIQHAARSQNAYFKRNRDGSVGNRFVSKRRSDFAQGVTIGAHNTTIHARPWLGTSEADENYLVGLARDYLAKAVSAR